MNSEERQLIGDLFGRMRGHGAVEKDEQAAAFIEQQMRAMPDAGYMLVQSVLVQEMALQQADQRIQDLESRVADLERGGSRAAPAAAGGSFLGGLFGGSRQPEPARPIGAGAASRGSVPAAGRPFGTNRQPSTPWGGGATGHSGMAPGAAPGGGGSFMRSAMATAAGVAGGMLLADGIRSMMSGDATAGSAVAAEAPAAEEASPADYQDSGDNDPGVQDAGWSDSPDFGGDFDV